ncbi:toxin-antitoxin system YwqK family antitoxin [Chitinophaga arvensicola]|uniref:MORN repeat variant n=1 Tax=Chitinophaga arvensicola TaxID=29529 RepID=A0A1I0S756_9BACT|nr:toxin-antitoxin system YwqK family antitoxin [Chitinophaga arvensicola]SEW51510.1 MORN repeat variant [Chitinophaga arvensicola]
MIKSLLILFFIVVSSLYAIGQNSRENIIYIVDSIPVIDDPEEENQLLPEDIADVTVIKNKDTLKILGYDKFDGAIYLFTIAYRKRADDIKSIPSSKQMERKNGIWHFNGSPYSGLFIDYYYSGRKQGEGTFQNGTLSGKRTMYYQNGKIATERYYRDGIENGMEKEYYEDGSLKQKGVFLNGKETGLWEMYFPNGQVKQRNNFQDGNMEGEVTIYYSTGKILAVEVAKNGKITPDKRLEKVEAIIKKGYANSKEGDYKSAIKNYSKAIAIDSANAEAFFARGTDKLNDFQFDEAILDFNKALEIEPYYKKALSNRAFARIRKYQYGSGRKLSENHGVTVIASKDKPDIPANELAIICADLKQAIFLGDRGSMIINAAEEFCRTNSPK